MRKKEKYTKNFYVKVKNLMQPKCRLPKPTKKFDIPIILVNSGEDP